MFSGIFEKVAINIKSARKAGKNIYKNVVRREFNHAAHTDGKAPNMWFSKAKETNGPGYYPDTKKIHAKTDTSKLFKRLDFGIPVPRNKKTKEMLNRLVHIHEQSEKKHNAKKFHKKFNFKDTVQRFNGHNHPGVLVEESNAIATLPKSHKAAGKSLSEIRSLDGSAHELESTIPGFKYGQTRLSRHAKKRVSEIMAKKYQDKVSKNPRYYKKMDKLIKKEELRVKKLREDKPDKLKKNKLMHLYDNENKPKNLWSMED